MSKTLTSGRYAYGGTDGAIHIAEEIPRPSKNIPLAMYSSLLPVRGESHTEVD